MCLCRLPSERQSLSSCRPSWHCAGERRQGLSKASQTVWTPELHFESCRVRRGGGPGTEEIRTCAQVPACRLRKLILLHTSSPPALSLTAEIGARLGVGMGLRHRQERDQAEVSQQLRTDPWEEPRPPPAQKLSFGNKRPEGSFVAMSANPNFGLKDLF